MASLYVENGQKVAIQFETDPDKINRQGGSTDMGNVSHIVPSIHPKFHIGTLASQHTPEFATHARKYFMEILKQKSRKHYYTHK